MLCAAVGTGCDEDGTRADADTEGMGAAGGSTSGPNDDQPDDDDQDPQDSDSASTTTMMPDGTTGGSPDEGDGSDSGESGTDDSDSNGGSEGGALFVLGNAAGPNSVVAFHRDETGALEELGEYATGGMGTGGGLGSQGALAVDESEAFLYVVNPGDDSISSLQIYDDHLALVDVTPTTGIRPTSLALSGEHVYVLNADGPGSVEGFEIDGGRFDAIPGATQPLSGHESPAPAQVGVTPDGAYLVVTERATNQIVTYEILPDGSLNEPVVNPSEGMTPFGFDFTSDGVMVVSEAFGGGSNPGASAASSYRVADGGMLWLFSSSIPSGQTAACWIQIVHDQFAISTNTGSDNLSGYRIDDEGAITLSPQSGSLFEFGEDHGPLDMTASRDDGFVYVLNGAADQIDAFSTDEDGMLTHQDSTPVPETSVGLIGY